MIKLTTDHKKTVLANKGLLPKVASVDAVDTQFDHMVDEWKFSASKLSRVEIEEEIKSLDTLIPSYKEGSLNSQYFKLIREVYKEVLAGK